MRTFFLLIGFALTTAAIALGQTQPGTSDPSITATYVIGEVKSVDASTKQIVVKTDAGSMVTAVLNDKTTYKRVAPGETSLANATVITLADIGEGDRVMALGKPADDHKTVPTRSVVVMNKGDIAKKQEQERMEWRRRGILGTVKDLKPDAQEITINTRTAGGDQPVIITIGEKVDMRRYAPDSIKFSDAKPSTLGDVQVGDQLRALGEKSQDGTHFKPERIVSGSFRTVAGTITAIDPATGEIKINDLQTKKSLTVVVKSDSVLRKFEVGGGMMMFARPGAGGPNGGGAAANGQAGQAQNKPAQGAGGAPAGGGQGPGGTGGARPFGGGGFNIQDILDRMPTISLADVKQGDTIIVSSTKGADPTRLTAITLVTGADTLLAMVAPRPAQGQQAPNPAAGLGSGINFGIGLP